ncbi:hypothetical protein [Paracoccus alcaliphilus]|nr:hypothetical protein [Paracoccus alcaliphilus]WCR17485.1 hypothetical protein JHW40_14275 [Paracoccus alcaliphilus]
MRSYVAVLALVSTSALAQEPAQETIPQQETSGKGRQISSTLPVQSEESAGAGLDATFPMLPFASAAAPSEKVTGFILNRQLVERTAREYPPTGVEIGQGWNSFLNRPSSNVCIEGTVLPLVGTHLAASFSSVQDRASYFESISGSVGGSYGPFGGSASYHKEKSFSN